ncbi:hypothetical protein [Aeromicrobium sp. CF3.5]|uniref:hypothetical protein n=1 Tax=Aeromicrobium sp. CF3.5 TaxID=3373078 RepID=UPI003EE5ED67
MPRRHSRRPTERPPARAGSSDHVEVRASGEWNVRPLAGSQREYTCPGCHRPVRPGVGHVLVWPVQKALLSAEAIDERRHWHTDCWRRGLS